MKHTDMPNKKIHQGRNIKRFREMLGIKQEALAFELGEGWIKENLSSGAKRIRRKGYFRTSG
jgi:hypothetical protein